MSALDDTFTEVKDTLLSVYASEFDTHPNREAIIYRVNYKLLPPNDCPALRADMVATYSAHILSLTSRALGATGDIASIKQNTLQIDYTKNSSKSDKEFASTTYGRIYLELMRRCNAGRTLMTSDVGECGISSYSRCARDFRPGNGGINYGN